MSIFFRRKRHKPLAELQLVHNNYVIARVESNGRNVIMHIDGVLSKIIGHRDLPFRVGIALKYLDQTDPGGMPIRYEMPQLDEMSDLIDEALEGPPRVGYQALRMTGDGIREWVSYVSEEVVGHGLAGYLQSMFPGYEVTHYVEHDPKWVGFRVMVPRSLL